jgi:hypothetical protein
LIEFRITHHANEEMARRQIPESIVEQMLRAPEQIVS